MHGHYWLSGQVGAVAKERWGVPLVQSMHTLGKVKNAALAAGDAAEPAARIRGEAEVVATADRLVANTDEEARQLIGLYDADPARVCTINPGVDLSVFQPGSRPRPGGGLAFGRTRSCWSSWAGSSRSRRPTWCCEPRPCWSATTRRWRTS